MKVVQEKISLKEAYDRIYICFYIEGQKAARELGNELIKKIPRGRRVFLNKLLNHPNWHLFFKQVEREIVRETEEG